MNPDAYFSVLLPYGAPGTVGMQMGILLNKHAVKRFLSQVKGGALDEETDDDTVHAALIDMFEGVFADVKFALMVPSPQQQKKAEPKIVAPPPGFDPGRQGG